MRPPNNCNFTPLKNNLRMMILLVSHISDFI